MKFTIKDFSVFMFVIFFYLFFKIKSIYIPRSVLHEKFGSFVFSISVKALIWSWFKKLVLRIMKMRLG